jgi:hypothetical protein
MYSKDTLKKIADVLKLDVSVFEANLKSDKEETLEVPVLYTEEAKDSFGKNRFEEGKKAMSEITAKDLKEKYSLDIQGKKLDDVIEAIAEKRLAEAKIKPDEKVTKLEAEKKELQGKYQEAIGKVESITKEMSDKLFQVETKSQIITNIPKNTIIPAEDLADLFMNRHRVTKEDNRVIVYKGDQALKDSVLNPLALKDVVVQFTEPYIKKEGMGGGDNGGGGTPGKFNTASELMDYMKKNNIEPMSDAGLKLYSDNKKAVATFDETK